jgi:hypothetical protein
VTCSPWFFQPESNWSWHVGLPASAIDAVASRNIAAAVITVIVLVMGFLSWTGVMLVD